MVGQAIVFKEDVLIFVTYYDILKYSGTSGKSDYTMGGICAMMEFFQNNIHWIGMGILLILFLISNFMVRKELPFKQAKEKIVNAAIFFAKVDGSRIVEDVQKEFMSFMNKYSDEFLKLLKSRKLISLRENINTDDLCKIGKLFAEFKSKFENNSNVAAKVI